LRPALPLILAFVLPGALGACAGPVPVQELPPLPIPAPPPPLRIEPVAAASAEPAPPEPEAPPPPLRTLGRVRRGLWIWEFGVNGPNAERAAKLADEWGVARVFVKSGNGNARGRWGRNFSKENLGHFHKRGIEVWAFAYFYGDDVKDRRGTSWGTLEDQVGAVGDATDQPGVAGLIVDAEDEFKKRGADATKLCALLRKRLPNIKVGYTSFGWIGRHKKFPFKEFDKGCGDVFMPQVYFSEGWDGGADASVRRMHEDAKKLGLKAPMWPIQSNEPNPEVAVMQRFFDLAGPDASVWFLPKEDQDQVKRLGQLRFAR